MVARIVNVIVGDSLRLQVLNQIEKEDKGTTISLWWGRGKKGGGGYFFKLLSPIFIEEISWPVRWVKEKTIWRQITGDLFM